ncbi:MAG: type VI secretion system baseplate subunit TssG [Syntrophobacteraceae bacterium]
MGTSERQPHPSVRKELFEAFFEFSFYKAVHLLETLNPHKKPLGEALTPGQEAVRFGVRPGFVFPPSDIAGLKPPAAQDERPRSALLFETGSSADVQFPLTRGDRWGEGESGIEGDSPDFGGPNSTREGPAPSATRPVPAPIGRVAPEGPSRMDVAFLGLLGPSGVLPHWYNELAQDRLRKKDSSLVAFLDCFHHRLISHFYLSWKKHRFPETYLPGARDRLSRYMLCLVGLGTPHLLERMGLDPESLIYYSGLLSRTTPCAYAVEAAVEYFSGTAVTLHQLIDRVIPIEPEDQTRLGMANASLGFDAACGSQAWENQTKFRVDLGPMTFKRFIRFLPSGDLLRPIFSLVRVMVGIEYEFDVGVILKREEVPPCRLGQLGTEAPRLGWTTWVKSLGVLHDDHPRVIFQEPARN